MPKSLSLTLLIACALFGSAAAHAQYDDPGPGPEPGGSCQTGDVVVNAGTNLRFSPDDVTIQVGHVVCFRNQSSSIPHNVHAPGFMQCAGPCDPNPNNPGASAVGDPAVNWVTRYKFDQAGTVNYRCDMHVSMGMTGRVVVQGATSGGPGALSFTTSNFSVSEGGGNATITARRTGGDDGAVSVQYATANGSATAGSDYTAKTGTLSWPDNDDNNKTFTVAITNDTADEANETVSLSLSSPTGGATLGSPSSATLTINDNDDGGPGPGPSAPAAPSNLKASPIDADSILLTWKDNASGANNETQFQVERRPLQGGAFVQIGTAPANATEFTAGGLTPASGYEFRVRATNSGGNSAYSNIADASTDTDDVGPCLESATALCLNNERFKVEVNWRTADGPGNGTGVGVPSAPDSGLFYFFGASNIEMLVKVINACPLNSRYWVFFAATTNVEFTLTVTDTQSGRTRLYFNPLNRPAPPIQDTDAFATCP
jgi:plastocyanin